MPWKEVAQGPAIRRSCAQIANCCPTPELIPALYTSIGLTGLSASRPFEYSFYLISELEKEKAEFSDQGFHLPLMSMKCAMSAAMKARPKWL